MSTQNFSYSFSTSKSPEEVYEILINPKNWWIGLHNEIITGKSENVNDEFSFSAGNGAYNSVQKLEEIILNEKIIWEVIESNLTFLKETDEWTGTKISFGISKENDKTKITFTHDGLIPEFECYAGCTGAWSQYLENLDQKLNRQ
ncbi:SRPBCC domain-containing protein [Chryseobacterium sp. Leaf394]|uniref:SRPBCC family protein n=1 Tax=Chryseobacterium sp. Leaf394 TaxID=1736361 RepID=UPI0006FC0F62|nr:SRPBCC domain-containing protein [Chryseobacterium sp. Leaf394]KQS92557.1 ATPase [Chryseobacterium sp. Leaf394]